MIDFILSALFIANFNHFGIDIRNGLRNTVICVA